MRDCAYILILLGAAAGWSASVEIPSPPAPQDSLDWVRTVDGWRRVDQLTAAPLPAPSLHPLTVASLQALACTLVLLSLDARRLALGATS